VPQVVDLNCPDLVLLADAPERAHQVPGLDRPTGPGGEYQIRLWPGGAHGSTVRSLPLGLKFECLARKVQQRQGSYSGRGLDGPDQKLTSDPLYLLADTEYPAVELDVTPT
jgi:hypothetical protein